MVNFHYRAYSFYATHNLCQSFTPKITFLLCLHLDVNSAHDYLASLYTASIVLYSYTAFNPLL